MPEGPETYRLAARLSPELVGSKITSISSRLKKAAAWLDAHPTSLPGREIRRIYAAGKNLIWELSGGYFLHFHMLMYGRFRTYALDEEPPPEPRLRVEIITTTRRAQLVNGQIFNPGRGDPFQRIPVLAALGADICAEPFDRELFLNRLSDPARRDIELGPALLEQSVAAGVGNYLKSDVLFECRLDPFVKVGALSDAARLALAEALPVMAQRALRGQGQTISDEALARLPAAPEFSRGWWDRHWVFRRSGRPCLVCGTRIRQRRQGPGEGRMTFFCPRCQGVEVEAPRRAPKKRAQDPSRETGEPGEGGGRPTPT